MLPACAKDSACYLNTNHTYAAAWLYRCECDRLRGLYQVTYAPIRGSNAPVMCFPFQIACVESDIVDYRRSCSEIALVPWRLAIYSAKVSIFKIGSCVASTSVGLAQAGAGSRVAS